MLPRSVIRAAAVAFVLTPGVQAGEIDLGLDPGLRFSRETSPDKKQHALIATLPLSYDHGIGCVLEFDLTVTGIWYYAPLKVGVRSRDGKTAIGLLFEKVGGEASQCSLYFCRDGQEKVAARWETVDCIKYRLILRWSRDGRVDFTSRRGTDVVYQASREGPSPLEPDDFFMRVMDNNDNGYIGYDCEEESIHMRSQPGGGDYVASAFIDFISMRTPAKGASK